LIEDGLEVDIFTNEWAVRLSFQPLISSQPAVFFSYNKSANSIFIRSFSAKRTDLNKA
jgi:hypothetical protein